MLRSLLKKHLIKGKTGQLLIKFTGEDHLCKISIEDGKAIYISLGRKSLDDALDCIGDKEIEDSSFIEDIPIQKRVDESLNDILFMITAIEGESSVLHADVSNEVPALRVEAAVNDFIDKVGPVGTVISENVLSKLLYEKGSPLSGEDYSYMLSSFMSEMPDNEKEHFKHRHLQ